MEKSCNTASASVGLSLQATTRWPSAASLFLWQFFGESRQSLLANFTLDLHLLTFDSLVLHRLSIPHHLLLTSIENQKAQTQTLLCVKRIFTFSLLCHLLNLSIWQSTRTVEQRAHSHLHNWFSFNCFYYLCRSLTRHLHPKNQEVVHWQPSEKESGQHQHRAPGRAEDHGG